jgi:nucleotide-binding universal stress UspA family protein
MRSSCAACAEFELTLVKSRSAAWIPAISQSAHRRSAWHAPGVVERANRSQSGIGGIATPRWLRISSHAWLEALRGEPLCRRSRTAGERRICIPSTTPWMRARRIDASGWRDTQTVEGRMVKVLVPVDGSEASKRATEKLVHMSGWCREAPKIDLLAVHLPVPELPHMSVVVSQEMLDRYYAEECEKMLAPSKAILDAAGVKYEVHTCVGPIAESIVNLADASGSDMIFMGTRGMTALSNMVLGSVATRVLHLAHVPVVLVH